MERNVCGADRTVRLAFGTALALGIAVSLRKRSERERPGSIARWHVLAAYAAGELLLTGLMQWCPGNYLLGIDTCEQDLQTALKAVRGRASPPSRL